MPWKSQKQAAWGHSVGMKSLGGADKVAEWDASTPKGSLPAKAGKKKKGLFDSLNGREEGSD